MVVEAIKKIFNGINPFQAKKKPELSGSKIAVTGQKALSSSTVEAPPSAKKFQAKPIKSEGWFSWITNCFRRKMYEWLKGEAPSNPAEVQAVLKSIGGKEMQISSEHGAQVRTMHLKASGILKAIQEARGKRVEINANGISASGFVFDKVPEGLEKTFGKLGILDSTYTSKGKSYDTEGPWVLRKINGKAYIFAKTDDDAMKNKKVRTEKGFSNNAKIVTSPLQIAATPQPTVVLGGGACSYYNSYRTAQEAAQFLIRGLDVVILEDKSSVMEPEAEHHVMAARDAIFEYLIDSGLTNNQIILKGLCFSSVPAVELAAARGGEVPVIIDQGYLDIKPVAVQMAANYVRPSLSTAAKRMANPFVNGYFSDWNLDYKMDHLKDLKGPLCVIVNENDDAVALEERIKMEQILKGMSYDKVSINNKSIKHAGPWYQDPQATKQLDKFLNQRINNQSILGVS